MFERRPGGSYRHQCQTCRYEQALIREKTFTVRKCKQCGEEKLILHFSPRWRVCKACNASNCRGKKTPWQLANVEYCRSLSRAWSKNNRDAARESNRNYRARRKSSGKIAKEQWSAVVEVFDSVCAYCFKKCNAPEMDHVEALSRGGKHEISNVVPACKSCNSRKGDRGILSMVNV